MTVKKTYFLIILAAVLMLAGVLRGEQMTVFLKSSNICMECIGIG